MENENNEEFYFEAGHAIKVPAGAPRRKVQGVMAFDIPSTHNTNPIIHTRYEIVSTVIFKPMGLLLKGTTPDTKIHSFTVGCAEQLIGSVPLPGAFYETGKSFAEMKELADNNELEWPSDEKLIFGDCDCADEDNVIAIGISGPLRHAAIWGYTLK